VEGKAVGIANTADGCVGYFCSVTNRSNRPLKVRLRHNESMQAISGVATVVRTTIQPKSDWNVALYPLGEPLPWSATLEYFPEESPVMTTFRRMGAFFRIRLKEPDWMMAQRIKIDERGK